MARPIEISLGDNNPPEENPVPLVPAEGGAEGVETENSVNNIVNMIEEGDKKDPVLSSKWVGGAKKFVAGSWEVGKKNIGLLLGGIGVMLWALTKGVLFAPVKIMDYAVKDAMKKGGAPDIFKKLVDHKPNKKDKK